jgi:glutamyl-tRNA synthetase
MQIEALKEFIMAQGASKNTNLQQWDKIWAINKQASPNPYPPHPPTALL